MSNEIIICARRFGKTNTFKSYVKNEIDKKLFVGKTISARINLDDALFDMSTDQFKHLNNFFGENKG